MNDETDIKKIINNLSIGCAYCKILFNSNGNPNSFKFTFVNEMFSKILGFSPEELLSKNIDKIIEKSENQKFYKLIKKNVIDLSKKNLNFYSKQYEKWYKCEIKFDSAYDFSIILYDISEEMVQINDFNILINSLNDIVFEFDEDLKFINVWFGEEDYMFLSKNLLINNSIDYYFESEIVEMYKKAFEKTLLENKKNSFQYKKEGLWYNATIFSRKDIFNKKRYIAVITEITEKKNFEEKLLEEKEAYESIVNSNEDLICRFLPDTTLIFVNDSYCKFFDKKREDLIGKRFLYFVPEEEHNIIFDRLKSVTQGNSVTRYSHKVISPDGNYIEQKWIDKAFFDEYGKIKFFQSKCHLKYSE